MADTKKTAIVKPAAKPVAAKAADTKTAQATTTPAASVAKTEPKKEETKKAAAAKKTTAKKTTTKKTTAKKEPAKKTTTAAVKETVHVQFADKSYTSEDLVKIAKDVWKYDLKKKVGDFKAVELYVKPEESVVYYVINGEERGQFNI